MEQGFPVGVLGLPRCWEWAAGQPQELMVVHFLVILFEFYTNALFSIITKSFFITIIIYYKGNGIVFYFSFFTKPFIGTLK